MHGYGRFAALSDWKDEEEEEREESREVVSSWGQYEASSSSVDSWDVRSELSIDIRHRETTMKPTLPGSEDPDDEAAFVSTARAIRAIS
ncbi:hypothetical protein N7481_011132 [Penicillium waksmanii]|uniref:uncharacterized protein n=1 Tax=Penicillium waksmanii TaxID=69791 RepID=UPI002547C618|nr:uncharacterized protein N7481_011132 [Penicillium waksmanii]KAJ5973922.1 hypothetical protein N7481_011132 [Penicillium waksmanii]